MRKGIISLFLLVSVSLIGCGTVQMTDEQPKQDKTVEEVQPDGASGIVAGELESSLVEKSPGVYEYRVKNQTEQMMMYEFTSSQRYDYSLSTSEGDEVYRFSSLANFLQSLGELKLQPGEELSYDINLNEIGLKAGDYVLTAWLTPSAGAMYKTSTNVSIVDIIGQKVEAEGIYQGMADPHTIEVEINGQPVALQVGQLVGKLDLEGIAQNTVVLLSYHRNEDGQNVLDEMMVLE